MNYYLDKNVGVPTRGPNNDEKWLKPKNFEVGVRTLHTISGEKLRHQTLVAGFVPSLLLSLTLVVGKPQCFWSFMYACNE